MNSFFFFFSGSPDHSTAVSLSTAILTLAAASLLSLLFLLRKHSKTHKAAPPEEASGGWPIIGHLHLLAGPRPPHIVLSQMAENHGPIFTIRTGVHRALVVSNWETAKEILTTHDRTFADRPPSLAAYILGYDRSMFGFSPYGGYWRELRKIATLELLSSHRLELLKHVRESEVNSATKELYRYWAENENGGVGVPVEMMSLFGEMTLNVILKMVVGKSVGYFTGGKDGGRLRKLFRSFFDLTGRFVVADALPWLRWLDVGGFEKEMRKTAEEMDAVVGEWLREHKEKRGSGGGEAAAEDFMDVIVEAIGGDGVEGRDSDTVNKATCLTLILGASDTTSVTMSWLLALLVNHPDVLKKAQIELDDHIGKQRKVRESDLNNLSYLKAIVKETLRLYPAAPLSVPHQSTEDCVVAGRFVPSGTRLFVNVSKIQRDPQVWSRPNEFRPDRFLTTHENVDVRGRDFEFIPFGSGRRMCPGVNFALQVMHLTVATLLHGFDFARPTGEMVDMTESIGITNSRALPLEVVMSPRLPSHMYG